MTESNLRRPRRQFTAEFRADAVRLAPCSQQAWGKRLASLSSETPCIVPVHERLHARRIVGWATSEHFDRHLVLGALRMAIGTRRPAAGLVHHTDRGSQYASRDYRQALQAAGIDCSMSRKGNCWDNAPAESSFATLKVEELRHFESNTREEARDTAMRNSCCYNPPLPAPSPWTAIPCHL
jgi:transposase InsO family protein